MVDAQKQTIIVISSIVELPKDKTYRMTDVKPDNGVVAYEYTNWLKTTWFVLQQDGDYDRKSSKTG